MQMVYLVGAGPGEKELITVKGKRLLQQCDAVIYDRLASSELLDFVKEDCVRIFVGKEAGHHSKSQTEINQILVEAALKYEKVVRLKGGDSFVFGRGGEEVEALQARGLHFELVPGITSAIAVPECAGIPVTHRGVSRSFHVITGHTKDSENTLTDNYDTLARLDGTLIFLMGLGNLGEITKRLMSHGKQSNTPVAVIEKGTTKEERMVKGTLKTIEEQVKQQQVMPPAIIVIGETALLSYKDLNCYIDNSVTKIASGEKKTIGITATSHTAKKLRNALEQEGFYTIDTCRMEVEETEEGKELNKAFGELSSYDWIMFTSPNAIRIFFTRLLQQGLDGRALWGLKLAVIGSGSRDALLRYGIHADFVPKTYTSKAFALEFAEHAAKKGERILLPRAKQGSRELTDILKEKGYEYKEISLYDVNGKLCAPREALEKVDCHVFVSASGVRSFFKEIEEKEPDYKFAGKIACIGEITGKEADKWGYLANIVAQVSDVEGVAASIKKYYGK